MSRKILLGLLLVSLVSSAVSPALAQSAATRQAATQPVGAQQNAAFQEAWDRYTVIVWRFKTPGLGEGFKKSLDSAGLWAVHLDGGSNGVSPDTVEFVRKHNLACYLDHAAGKGYLHLVSPDREQVIAKRDPVARPKCLSDPATMEAMKKLIKMNVEAAMPTRCVGYAFDDEISPVSFTSPCDTCTSKFCLERFRRMLKNIYGQIETLNKQWGSDYKSFDDVSIVGAEQTRLANHEKPLNEWNLSGWVDSREYIDQNFADTLRELVEFTNRIDPRRPAGFVGGGAPSAYGGYNYEKLCKVIQWIEAYDIACSDAIIRSLMPQNPRVQTWFDNRSIEKNTWYAWYYWAQGDRGQIIWPATGETDPWFRENAAREDIQALKPAMLEIQGDKFGPMLVGADYATDGIALYYSHPSVRVSWFIDIIPHGATWINRSSSLNNANDSAHWNRYGWTKLLDDCGFTYNFVTPSQVAAGELTKKNYRVLILGRTLALSDAEVKAIRQFVAGGGHIIADHLCGIFDEHGKARQGALDDLFGVSRNLRAGLMNGKVLYEIDAELHTNDPLEQKVTTAYQGAPTWQGLVVYERGLVAREGKATATVNEMPVVVKNKRAVYLNLSPVSYCIDRYDPSKTRWPQLITGLLAEAGVRPRARVLNAETGEPELITQTLYWKLGTGRTAMVVVKNLFRSAQIDAAGETQGTLSAEPTKIRLRFASPVRGLRNERTGKTLGDGKDFADTWVTCEANVYTFE